MTYDELVRFMSIDDTVIVCKNFAQRRDAANMLIDMGFEYEATTEDYMERSELSGDEQFLNPGIRSGEILCYNTTFFTPNKKITFGEVLEIMDEKDKTEMDENEQEFEERFYLMMKKE